MRPPTGNIITQGQHGSTKAVDYSWYRNTNDDKVYAPEDGVIESYRQRGSGTLDAGNCMRLQAGANLHQFAHLSRALVAVGSRVKKGQAIAVMGATGYTVPKGAKHLHWWILRNGVYVYPPKLITEKFGGPVAPFDMPRIGAVVTNSQPRTVFKRDSNVALGVIQPPMAHVCRGYDSKFPNRMYGHSAKYGDFSMALYYTDGKRIEGVSW